MQQGILCRSLTPKRHRQLRVKDLPKVPTWRLERNSNPTLRTKGVESTNEPPLPTSIGLYLVSSSSCTSASLSLLPNLTSSNTVVHNVRPARPHNAPARA